MQRLSCRARTQAQVCLSQSPAAHEASKLLMGHPIPGLPGVQETLITYMVDFWVSGFCPINWGMGLYLQIALDSNPCSAIYKLSDLGQDTFLSSHFFSCKMAITTVLLGLSQGFRENMCRALPSPPLLSNITAHPSLHHPVWRHFVNISALYYLDCFFPLNHLLCRVEDIPPISLKNKHLPFPNNCFFTFFSLSFARSVI